MRRSIEEEGEEEEEQPEQPKSNEKKKKKEAPEPYFDFSHFSGNFSGNINFYN